MNFSHNVISLHEHVTCTVCKMCELFGKEKKLIIWCELGTIDNDTYFYGVGRTKTIAYNVQYYFHIYYIDAFVEEQ